ncbi:MAG: hypothetical protein IK092_03490 [Muribaculaceae bacterium]|nr:hypothetical protein [Muribaculaceae bacterium]
MEKRGNAEFWFVGFLYRRYATIGAKYNVIYKVGVTHSTTKVVNYV